MVNDFVYSVRSLGLMFGLLNNERKGTKKYAHMQIEIHLLPLHLKCRCKSLVILRLFIGDL